MNERALSRPSHPPTVVNRILGRRMPLRTVFLPSIPSDVAPCFGAGIVEQGSASDGFGFELWRMA